MQQWCKPGEAAVAYASLIYFRVRDGMLINDWKVDWAHEPLTHSYYETDQVESIPLPSPDSDLLQGVPESSPDYIAGLLYCAYGFTGLRLITNRNDRSDVYRSMKAVKFGRHTASGGGRYCADFYLVESGRGSGHLPPGIYHYSPLRHVWETLAKGDYTHDLARAQGYESTCERYLLLTIDYWRSGFKYNDFAYQATAMDIGTVVGSIAEITGERTAGTWDVWINEVALSKLLGLDTDRTGIYAVQGWGEQIPTDQAKVAPGAPQVPPRVDSDFQNVMDFSTTLAMQRDMQEFGQRPATFTCNPVPNCPGARGKSRWWEELHRRQTSFGRFTGEAYPARTLTTLLEAADAACEQFRVATGDGQLEWEYLVFVSNVDGLKPGLYSYRDAKLKLVQDDPQQDFLAGTYFLKNYDGRKAAATIIPCANVFEVSKRWGVRGYRLVNALIGAACQAISVEAVRCGVGTGTALGFDAQAHAEHAGMGKDEMTPMLMIMTGVDNPYAGEFRTDASLMWGDK
ncbi:nitroreductase family protein [Gleimia europaea]|uniref:SagB-type dehydrogenase domain-containing protein n=1 Tax=Gleimia europaea ACS-120-V-Col10b TaxID=883069 RepID=A0A9W5RCV8_9ACTO|nr:nitroreductase family protein [Gleimia europaea]EPD29426.1 SagB-type dehydrogenase domain-containing protein [Gleimia europaea ACS-120-V-Col10b]